MSDAKTRAWEYLNSLQYIPCRDQFELPTTAKTWVIEHEMVAPERHDMAESLGRYFQNPERPASTHFGVDDDSAVRYSEFYWLVYGTEQTGNVRGWHIEHAGDGNQEPGEWFDEFSQRMLKEVSSKLTAALCVVDDIPVRHVGVAELRQGVKGISTHYEMCQAFMPGNQSQWHYDPKNFPMDYFLPLVEGWVHFFNGDDDDMSAADVAAIRKDIAELSAKVAEARTENTKWHQDTRERIIGQLSPLIGKFRIAVQNQLDPVGGMPEVPKGDGEKFAIKRMLENLTNLASKR